MEIIKILLGGIKNTNLNREFLTIVLISFVAAILELLGLAAFSYLMVTVFSDEQASGNIFIRLFSLFGYLPSQNFIIFLFVFLFTLNIFSSFFSGYFIHKIISLKFHHFRTYVFNQYIKKDLKEIIKNSSDEMINKISVDPGKFLMRGFGSFCIIIKNLIVVTIIFIYLIYFNFYTIYILIFFLIFFSVYFIPKVSKFFKEISSLERAYNIETFLSPNNIIQNFKEIKLFLAESFFSKKFYESSKKLYRTQLRLLILRNLPKFLIEFALIVIITIFFVNFSQSSSKDTTFIFFSTLIFSLIRLIPYIIQITRSYTEILGAQEYIYSFLKQDYPTKYLNKKIVEKTILEGEVKKKKGEMVDSQTDIDELSLINIDFKFKDKIIFESLNLKIKRKEKVLIYGDSGVGKSILLEIISGFRDNYSGNIFINGKKTNNELLKSLKNRIGLVSQNISFINSSLIENIAFGEDINEIDIKSVKRSLKLAGLNEFSNDEKLYNFKINPDFKNISEGQAKRLALARLFYFQKSILLLDETTANLDKRLEIEILKDLIDNTDLTVILVSHDPILREVFEKVYKVENKKLVEIK